METWGEEGSCYGVGRENLLEPGKRASCRAVGSESDGCLKDTDTHRQLQGGGSQGKKILASFSSSLPTLPGGPIGWAQLEARGHRSQARWAIEQPAIQRAGWEAEREIWESPQIAPRLERSVLPSFPIVPSSLQKSGLSCHPEELRERSMVKLGLRVHTSKRCLLIWGGWEVSCTAAVQDQRVGWDGRWDLYARLSASKDSHWLVDERNLIKGSTSWG